MEMWQYKAKYLGCEKIYSRSKTQQSSNAAGLFKPCENIMLLINRRSKLCRYLSPRCDNSRRISAPSRRSHANSHDVTPSKVIPREKSPLVNIRFRNSCGLFPIIQNKRKNVTFAETVSVKMKKCSIFITMN